MVNEQPNNPLHGITLDMILSQPVNLHRPEGFGSVPQVWAKDGVSWEEPAGRFDG